MKRVKGFLGKLVVLSVAMSMSLVASASGNSKSVTGYNTLGGSVGAAVTGGYRVITSTTVLTNPDNAYLKTKIDLQDMYGNTQASYVDSSSRGATQFLRDFSVPHFDDVNAIYGAHNVQGGKTYGAQVVYTVTTSIPH